MIWNLHPIERFSAYASQWDTLQRSSTNAPFLEAAFLQPLLEEFGTGSELLAMGFERGQLRAAAIVKRARAGLWQSFQPAQLPLGAWVAHRDDDLQALSRSLVRALPGLSLGLGVTQVDPMFQNRPDDGAQIRIQDYIDTAWVDVAGNFDAYWDARGKNLKQNTRKQRSKLHADGMVTSLDCVTSPEGVEQAIRDYGALESAGWKAAGGTAVNPDNAQGRFYRKVLESFCALGRGRIYRYRFGDKVVSMDLCLDNGSMIVILKTAYDESYKTVSPSTLMRQDEFRHLFEEGRFQRIEFYGKVLEWHTRWTTQSRTVFHATTYRWPLLKRLHRQFNGARRVAQAISGGEAAERG